MDNKPSRRSLVQMMVAPVILGLSVTMKPRFGMGGDPAIHAGSGDGMQRFAGLASRIQSRVGEMVAVDWLSESKRIDTILHEEAAREQLVNCSGDITNGLGDRRGSLLSDTFGEYAHVLAVLWFDCVPVTNR
jgi:hypothetical protein